MRFENSQERLVFWGFGATGTTALIYEVVWSTALTNTIGSTVYSFSIVLAAFMAGLAIGSQIASKYLYQKDNVYLFGLLQLGLGLFGIATLYFINSMGAIYATLFYSFGQRLPVFMSTQLVLVFFVMLLPTSLIGASFPVAVRVWAKRQPDFSANAGSIYAINTWGAVLGALIAGILLVPLFGLGWTNTFAALISLSLALLAFYLTDARRFVAVAVGAAMITVSSMFYIPAPGLSFGYGMAGKFGSLTEFNYVSSTHDTVFNKESPYGRVQVLTFKGQDSDQLILINGGRIEGGTGGDIIIQKILVHLPMIIHKNPKSLLNIGLGTGMTVATAKEYKELQRIDDVEINQAVREAVDKYFYPGLFEDKRLNAINDDARHYLLSTNRRYDIIVSEPSYPTSKAQSHLFTKEFYQIAASKLNDQGIYVQWLPRHLMNRDDVAIAFKTMAAAFPTIYAWDLRGQEIVLVGLKSSVGLEIDPNQIDARLLEVDKQVAAASKYSASSDDLAYLMNDASIPLNLDDLPRIEFATVRNIVTGALGEITGSSQR